MRVTKNARIAIEPEVKTLQSGKQVANFSIAINEGYKNKQGEWVDKPTFVRCSYWKQESKILPFLTKGKLIEVDMFLEAVAYKGKKDKQIKAAFQATVRSIKLLESKKETVVAPATVDSPSQTNDDLPF